MMDDDMGEPSFSDGCGLGPYAAPNVPPTRHKGTACRGARASDFGGGGARSMNAHKENKNHKKTVVAPGHERVHGGELDRLAARRARRAGGRVWRCGRKGASADPLDAVRR